MIKPGDILDPFEAYELIQLGQMNGNTTPKLPPMHIRLIGLYMLMPSMLERLLGLVAFMEEQNNAKWAGQLADVSNTLNQAIAKNNPEFFVQIYNPAFATVTGLIAGSETKLLHAAAVAGNRLAVAQLLMVNGIDVNAKDKRGYTALMYAASEGDEAVVAELLKASGIKVNAKNNNSGTALMCAARDGYTAVVAALLKMDDIDMNATGKGVWTALMWAAWNRHKAVVHALCLKQLLDAPSDTADAMLKRLNAEIKQLSSSMTITPLSLCDHLLESLNKLPTQDEKTALLNKALSNGNAFSALMQQEGLKQRIQNALNELNTPSTPVIFSIQPAISKEGSPSTLNIHKRI